MVRCKPVHVYRESSCNPKSSTLETDRLQLVCPATCVITPATPISLHFHSWKENSSAHFKNVTIVNFFFFFFFTLLFLNWVTWDCVSQGVSVHIKKQTLYLIVKPGVLLRTNINMYLQRKLLEDVWRLGNGLIFVVILNYTSIGTHCHQSIYIPIEDERHACCCQVPQRMSINNP